MYLWNLIVLLQEIPCHFYQFVAFEGKGKVSGE